MSYYALIAPELAIDLVSCGKEWESHLQKSIAEELGSTATEMRTEAPSERVPFHHVRLTPRSDHLSGVLLMIPLEGNKLALVLETPDVPTAEELGLWRRTYERATAAVGSTIATYEWSSVISCTDNWYPAQELDGRTAIGGLSLEPSGVTFETVTAGARPSLAGWQPRTSYPVRVSGSSTGYDYESAMREASASLHLLCCLMTCAWGSAWGILEAPRPRDWGEIPIPTCPAWYRRDAVDDAELQHNHVTISDSMNAAWDVVSRDSVLRNAASAFKEATELHRTHPSFALVAYVAAIEGVGQKFKKPKHCPECKMILESTSRFRQAADRVSLAEEAEIVDQVARLRTTAHQGELHGTETTVGAWYGPSFFQVEPAQEFERILNAMRRIGRALLRQQLSLL